ncbi:hypothetical protein T484DRAFT_1919779, partial [Baffinella frigidus]
MGDDGGESGCEGPTGAATRPGEGGSVPDISPREGPADCVSKVPQLFVLKVFDSSAEVETEEWHTADAASGAGVETSSPTFDHQTISSQTHVSLPSQIPVSIFARCSAEENQPHFDQEVPEEFVCPITCEIIREPVVALDGFVYEKDAIESWFTQSNCSPCTNAPLDSIMLVPCHTLRCLIQ